MVCGQNVILYSKYGSFVLNDLGMSCASLNNHSPLKWSNALAPGCLVTAQFQSGWCPVYLVWPVNYCVAPLDGLTYG